MLHSQEVNLSQVFDREVLKEEREEEARFGTGNKDS